MPFNVGPMELVIVLVIALIILGPKRLPEAGRSIGNGMREFKESLSGNPTTTTMTTSTRRSSAAAPSPSRPRSLTSSRCGSPAQLLDDIIAHARADAPNECCGMIASRDGEAVAVHRARNAAASPLRYEIEGMEQYGSRPRSRTRGSSSARSTTPTRARRRCRRRPTSTSRSIPRRCT